MFKIYHANVISIPLWILVLKRKTLKKNNFSKWKVVNKSVSFIAQFPWVRIWIKNFVFLQILTQGNCDRNLFRVALCSRYCNKIECYNLSLSLFPAQKQIISWKNNTWLWCLWNIVYVYHPFSELSCCLSSILEKGHFYIPSRYFALTFC